HAEPYGSNVARLVQRLAQRNLSLELTVVVLRTPSVALRHRHGERRVVEDVRRRTAVLNRSGVDDRLERRAGLPVRLRSPIELRVVEVATADHRTHFTIARIHRDERALEIR